MPHLLLKILCHCLTRYRLTCRQVREVGGSNGTQQGSPPPLRQQQQLTAHRTIIRSIVGRRGKRPPRVVVRRRGARALSVPLTWERSLVWKRSRRERSRHLDTAGQLSRRTVSIPLASNSGVCCPGLSNLNPTYLWKRRQTRIVHSSSCRPSVCNRERAKAAAAYRAGRRTLAI